MRLSFSAIAFGAVGLAALTLVSIGPPGSRSAGYRDVADSSSSERQDVVTATGVRLASVDVTLPGSDRMFPGQGAGAINNNCLACHSAGMVLNQPVLTRSQWQAEVNKMRGTYKAPVAEDDVAAIVDYLVSVQRQ